MMCTHARRHFGPSEPAERALHIATHELQDNLTNRQWAEDHEQCAPSRSHETRESTTQYRKVGHTIQRSEVRERTIESLLSFPLAARCKRFHVLEHELPRFHAMPHARRAHLLPW